MASSFREKIVRIEESTKEESDDDMTRVLISADTTYSRSQSHSRENTVSAISHEKAMQLLPQGDVMEAEEFEDEEDDKLPDLPDGWPKIPQIFERRSWDFCTTVAPSVNKAASHLELLQGIIEEWFKEADLDLASRASSRKTLHSRPGTVESKASFVNYDGSLAPPSRERKRLRFLGSPDTYDSDQAKSVSGQSQLSIQGIGTKADPVEPAPLEYELPYLGADEVIEEVITLMARMENDRQETLETLKRERGRSKTLRVKIDNHCRSKLVNLPQAVQAEHEACANDISELHWHVSYQSRNEERIGKRCEVAETLNEKLKEDIAFIKGHIPLVAEKLELEKEAMARIHQAQKDTDDELNLTMGRCAKVKAKSDEAHMKAEEERASIKKDLDNVKEDLSRITEELSAAKMNFNSYIHLANDYRTQIHDNEQELQILLVKNENSKAAAAMQETKVKDLQQKVRAAEYEQKNLEDENEELHSDKEWKKKRHQEILEERAETIENQKERRKILIRKNKELDMDIEDLTFKMNDCDKQKTADVKNVDRMIKELERTEKQYDTTLEELAQVTIMNAATREQLQIEEDKTLQAEEQLRGTADALKRQVKEEMQSKAIIAAKITADSGESENFNEESTVKQEKVVKTVAEVEGAVTNVQKKVEKLRNAKKERNKKIADLKKEKDKFEEITKEVIEVSEQEKGVLLPAHTEMTKKVGKLTKKIEVINKQSALMTNKMEEMTSAGGMMVRSISNTSKAIDNLGSSYEELTVQIKVNQVLDDELQGQLDVTNARMSTQTKHHRELMEARQAVLKQHELELKQNIAYNTVIASRYRKLTNDYVTLRNKQLDKYDATVNAEHTIKDAKQLQGLQKKMHSAMNVYLKYRGMYNKGELQRIEQESNKSCEKVSSLQGNMDVALDQISDFLQNQLDGDTIRKMAMDKVDREEKQAKLAPTATVHGVSTGVQSVAPVGS